jgi:hydroxymethylglutaryl-CoA lyase
MSERPAAGGVSGTDRISIRDCAPRDGLQGETPRAPAERASLATRLFAAGLADVEVAAFVSPKAVPAMAGAAEVVAAVHPPAGATAWVLVPNGRGAELAVAAGADHLTVTVSASAAYGEKNTGMTIDASVDQVSAVRAVAGVAVVDAVVSCAFGSPFAGEVIGAGAVAALVRRLREAGADRVTLADTTGAATPRRVRQVIGATGPGVGLHLHDTRATALVNAHAALALGVSRFDTALGGLGGSPFAPGAGGNLATEDLVLLLDDLGVATGVDLGALIAAGPFLAGLVGHPVPSRVAAAGPLPPFEE